ARFEFQSAEFQNTPHAALEVLDDILVPDSQDSPGQHCVPVSHELEIGPVIPGDILDAVGELLALGEQLPQVANAARHGIAPHVDDPGVRQHEMDESDVMKVVGHFVDKEWLSTTVSTRVRDVPLAKRANLLGRKFGKKLRVTFALTAPQFTHSTLDVG